MNKNQYKVIFNKKRGQMMVVAENQTNHSHAAADTTIYVQSAAGNDSGKSIQQLRLLTFSVMLATGMVSFAYAGGIQTDKSAPVNLQPIIHQSANGTPLVNIQTPSQSGVSVNQYQQFDVDRKGAILNNSQHNVQTQIGGWIQNNPLMNAGEAKVIVNQVNSSNPSYLNGYVEVAGRRAEVIIANPSGINVNGGGFINAAGVTLTTGKPQINNGSLEGFRVRTGQINISGQGLDTSHSDYTKILAQAAQINAGIWANDLAIVAGRNNIDAEGRHTAVSDEGKRIVGAAIDTGHLGGMYAGKIMLVSSDKGVGVNHAGQIYAGAGGVTIDVNGHLTNNNSIVASDKHQSASQMASLHISAETLSNNGRISGQGDSHINTDNLKNSGTIASVNTLYIENKQHTHNDGKILADGNVRLESQSLSNPGTLTAGQDMSVQLKHDFKVDTDIQAGHDLFLSTKGDLDNAHVLQAGSSVHLDAHHINNQTNAIIQANTLTQLYAQHVDNRGLINSNEETFIHADNKINNQGSGKIYGTHVAIAAASLINQNETTTKGTQSGTIAARERLDIGATEIKNREHAVLSSENTFVVGGHLDTAGHAVDSASTLDNVSAKIVSNGDMTLNVDSFSNQNNHFKSSMKEMPDSWSHITAYVPDGDGWYDSSHLTGIGSEEAIHIDGKEFEDYTKFDYMQHELRDTVDESDPAMLQSKGHLTLNGTTLINDKSQILANGITLTQNQLQHIDAEGNHIVIRQGTSQHHYIGWNFWKTSHKSKWNDVNPYTPADQITPVKLNVTQFDAKHAAAADIIKAEIRTVTPNIKLPDQSIFGINRTNHHHPIIETDPAFVNYRQWLDSDYMLTALGQRFDHGLQRLGDGYYEQGLINDQIAQLTGKVRLDGYLSNEEQYKALMDAGVAAAKKLKLKPGVALSQQQIALLTKDIVWLVKQSVTLSDGAVVQALVPQVYVVARHDAPNGQGTLIAADQINMHISDSMHNNASIVGHQQLDIVAKEVTNNGGLIQGDQVKVSADGSVNNIGGQFIAEHHMTLSAGQDLNSTSTTEQTHHKTGQSHFEAENISRQAGIYVTGKDGELTASAGKNIKMTATDIGSAGSVSLQANQNVVLDTVNTSHHDHSYGSNNDQITMSSSADIGSQIQANGDITIQSGESTDMRAAQINSSVGTVSVKAGKDVIVNEGRATEYQKLNIYEKDKNPLITKEKVKQIENQRDTAVSSEVTGKKVVMQAGHDIDVKGSHIIADQQTTLTAEHDVTIQAAADLYRSDSDEIKKKTGVMSDKGKIGFSVGQEKNKLNTEDTSVIHSGSSVGSLKGDTTIVAHEHYQQTGSTVSALQGNVTIEAKQADIAAAENHYARDVDHTYEKKAVSVTANVAVIGSVQNAVSAIEKIGKSKDRRVKAMANANAAYDIYQAAQSIMSLAALQNSVSPSVKVSVAYGEQKSHEHIKTEQTQAAASNINAGNQVRIVAAGSNQSDINVTGADVAGKGGTQLLADGAVNLHAAKQVATERSDNSSSGWSAGVAVAYDKGASLGATGSVNGGMGHSDSEDVTYRHTHVGDANSKTLIKSGGATHIKGTQVMGKGIEITAAELNVESVQNTSVYDSKQQDIGAEATVGYGVSGSGNYSQSKIKADYASVTEQSGVFAGDEGYQINVAGNTDLKGALITSSQTAETTEKNNLTTGSLTYSDIKNHANYKGSSFGIGSNMGVAGDKGSKEIGSMQLSSVDKTGISSSSGFGFDKDHENSTTHSGINTSNITITDNKKQQELTHKTAEQTIADVHTDSTTDNYAQKAGYLNNNFDKEKVSKELNLQREISQEFSHNVQSVKGIVNSKIDQLKLTLDNKEMTQAEYDEKVKQLEYLNVGLNTVSAALSSPADSGVGIAAAAVSPSVAYAIGQHFKSGNGDDEVNHILAHAVLGAAVAAAGGHDSVTAAISAGGAEAVSPVLANWLYGTDKQNELTADQKSVISTIASMAGTGVGAVTGNAADMVSDGQLAQNAVDNNYLTKQQASVINLKLSKPSVFSPLATVIDAMEVSQKQDDDLVTVCSANPGSAECTDMIKHSLEYNGGVNGDIEDVRSYLRDHDSSTQKLLNVLYNGKKAESMIVNRVNSIDDRANFFGTNNYYYSKSGIPVKWFGGAEEVSRRGWTGLGADGKASYVTFSGGYIFLGSKLYEWRSEAGNSLMQGGFQNFKNLYNGHYDNAVNWDINQLKNEQKTLQPIHVKYLKNEDDFISFTNGVTSVDLLDYPGRVNYGCKLMGYKPNQGCKP